MSLTNSSPELAARAASFAARNLAVLPLEARNEALTAIHQALSKNKTAILEANARDMESAIQASVNGTLSQSVLKRLDLSRPEKYDDMLQGILDVRKLDDPIGQIDLRTLLDDGLELTRVSCPIGVLLIIFEARPEVIANIAALAIKSGNAAILKGGKESTASFQAISTIISTILTTTLVPNAAIQLVTTRDVIDSLLSLDQYVDLVIPRGSNELVQYIKSHTKIPVLGHADGLCSIYIHDDADIDMSIRLVIDSKCDYPSACNAVETLLIHEAALTTILPPVVTALVSHGVTIISDLPAKRALESTLPPASADLIQQSTEKDYNTEFSTLTIAIKTVPAFFTRIPNGVGSLDISSHPEEQPTHTAVDLAVAHINSHSSKHTDCIITQSAEVAEQFMDGVDSAGVYWNASTRFADGMRYGFGTEVGISTGKIHARGPVGLGGLTTYKYKLRGMGQVVADYGLGEGKKGFKHERMVI